MSNSIYSEPNNTPDVLYLNYYGCDRSFGELSDQITAHFGEDVKLNEFTIGVERHQVRGCTCCNDSSDYEQYLVITRRTHLQDDTAGLSVSSLAVDSLI